MYISEIAPLNLRGGLGTVNQLAVTVGLLLSQVLGIEQILGTDEGWPILLGKSTEFEHLSMKRPITKDYLRMDIRPSHLPTKGCKRE